MITLKCTNKHCPVELQVNGINVKTNQVLREYGKINKLINRPYEINCPRCQHPMEENTTKD